MYFNYQVGEKTAFVFILCVIEDVGSEREVALCSAFCGGSENTRDMIFSLKKALGL